MKIVRENFFLFFLLLIAGIIFIEIVFGITTFVYSGKLINTIFDESSNISINKLIILTEIINNSTLKLFSKFRADLIVAGKHLNFLRDISPNLQYYKNFKEDKFKNIISSKYEDILSNDIIKAFYDNKTNTINYIKSYEMANDNLTESNIIIDNLFDPNMHKELNLIGYFNSNSSSSSISERSNIVGKYLISILKALYVGRYVIKRKDIEYLRFILFHENECFIYPPDAYNNTDSYNYSMTVLKKDNFPYSIFSRMNEYLKTNYMFHIVKSDNHLIMCVSIPYYNEIDFLEKKNIGYICSEIKIENLFKNFVIEKKTKLQVFCIANSNLTNIYFEGRNLSNSNLTDVFNSSFSNYQFKRDSKLSFFHLLYYDLFEEYPSIEKDGIFKEYNNIYNIFEYQINNFIKNFKPAIGIEKKIINFQINKTTCYKNIYNNNYRCSKELYLVIINPLSLPCIDLDNNFFLLKANLSEFKRNQNLFFTIAILATNERISKSRIIEIIKVKLLKILFYFLLLSLCIASFITLLLMLIFRCYFSGLDDVIKDLQKFLFYIQRKNSNHELPKFNCSNNKEMKELSKIFNSLNINYILKRTIENESSVMDISQDLTDSLNHIKNQDIKSRYIMIIAHYYYEKGFYEKAENQFSSLLNYINDKENNYLINNDYDENKIKDTISRKSNSAYLNEYSMFKGISDNILSIIKIKLLKQKVNYLHGMAIFKLILQNNKNRNYIFKNRKKNEKYLHDAIKNFRQCREINAALGVNPIIEIFSLIMMARCYMIISNYKKSISNLNDALVLFERLAELFKDESGEKFNPKVMLFVLNTIFQSIMLSISQCCFFFNKNFACNWISIKILETSPFIISNVFYENCFFSQNSLHTILKRKTLSNNTSSQQIQSYYSKIFSRINIRFKNNKFWKDRLNFYNFANPFTTTMKRISLKMENAIPKTFSSKDAKRVPKYFFKKSKLITICISEKVILNLNGTELKDVIVKYLQKFFTNNENDSFSFIQFTFNGKKSIYLKPEKLDLFLKRFQTNKDALRMTEYLTNNEIKLTELSNLFDFMIKQQREEYTYKNNSSTAGVSSYPSGSVGNSNKNKNSNNINSSDGRNSSNKKSVYYSNYSNNNANYLDKIILLFIKSDDLRFTSQEQCINIVNDLNKNNCTVIIFCYDEEIKMDKIFNIYCLLGGLFDGYFFQVKNYQQIKQALMNFSTINYQENFSNLNFENLELVL